MAGLIGRMRGNGLLAVGPNRDDLLAKVQRHVEQGALPLVRSAPYDEKAKQGLEDFAVGLLVRDGVPLAEARPLATNLVADIAGLGPFDPFVHDQQVTELMANGPDQLFIERAGRIERLPTHFDSRDHLLGMIQRLIAPTGRRLDVGQPFVDARLADGARLHAVIPPIAPDGPLLTIRRFPQRQLRARDLLATGFCPPSVLAMLVRSVRSRANMIISGATSSGKTTLLNVLAAFIPGTERIITIEEAVELRIRHAHVVRLEARNPNHEGRGEVTLRHLVRNALRMRPDRIIIGEVRGPEAFDLAQALNTGHAGSLSTLHANSAFDALTRFETMMLMAADRIPHALATRLVRATIDIVVHLHRSENGREILEVLVQDENSERGYATAYTARVKGGAGNSG